MRIKSGVQLDGVHVALWYAATVYDWLRQANGLGEGTITSARDSVHGATSWHPGGLALDFRTTDLMPDVAAQLAAAMTAALGAYYDVIDEGDHIHVELSPAGLQAFGIR